MTETSFLNENRAKTSTGGNTTDEFPKVDPAQYINEDFLQILDEHRKTCEREGKIDLASRARKRLKDLRIFEEKKRKE